MVRGELQMANEAIDMGVINMISPEIKGCDTIFLEVSVINQLEKMLAMRCSKPLISWTTAESIPSAMPRFKASCGISSLALIAIRQPMPAQN